MPTMSILFILITSILSVRSVPIETPTKFSEPYDVSQFDEVHDQRQNGTENWRVNLDKIVLVWTPPGGLLTAALLAEPGLFGEENAETEEFFKPEKPGDGLMKPEKPGDGSVKPEAAMQEVSTTEKSTDATTEGSGSTSAVASRRRLRVPGFLRPFLRRHVHA